MDGHIFRRNEHHITLRLQGAKCPQLPQLPHLPHSYNLKLRRKLQEAE